MFQPGNWLTPEHLHRVEAHKPTTVLVQNSTWRSLIAQFVGMFMAVYSFAMHSGNLHRKWAPRNKRGSVTKKTVLRLAFNQRIGMVS